MDWRKATRRIFHEGLGIEKCPAEIVNRKKALHEAVKIAQSRRIFFTNIGKATSVLGLYFLTVDTPWHKTIMNATKTVFQTGPSLSRTRYTFSGSSSKTTETFHIPTEEWRISYEVNEEPRNEEYFMFVFFVYPTDSIIWIDMGGAQNFGKDYTIIHHGPGDYYLRIASLYCNWKITVTAPP